MNKTRVLCKSDGKNGTRLVEQKNQSGGVEFLFFFFLVERKVNK